MLPLLGWKGMFPCSCYKSTSAVICYLFVGPLWLIFLHGVARTILVAPVVGPGGARMPHICFNSYKPLNIRKESYLSGNPYECYLVFDLGKLLNDPHGYDNDMTMLIIIVQSNGSNGDMVM
ncbi:hypothetical protein AMTRI_Chr09g33880 [Amborella trichopoda]